MHILTDFSKLLLFAIVFATKFANAAEYCHVLFDRLQSLPAQNESETPKRRRTDAFPEKRDPTKSWLIVENFGTPYASGQFSFMKPSQSLSLFYYGSRYSLVKEEVVSIQGQNKIKQDEIPLEVKSTYAIENTHPVSVIHNSVIDANIESGRRFFIDMLESARLRNRPPLVLLNPGPAKDRPGGVLIFVDVNNLGWVNKNFHNQKVTGDSYIAAVMKALVKVTEKNGMVFRLGGDEFAITLPVMSAIEVHILMNRIVEEVKASAHSVFREESIRRALAFRRIHKAFKEKLITEDEYNKALDDFKAYASYSQEGVSLGAAYIDNRPAAEIQAEAEQAATKMKIALKQALHLDVSKYTGTTFDYQGAPRLNYKYDIPLLVEPNSIHEYISAGFYSVPRPNLPPVQKMRGQVVYRFAHANVVRYTAETGEPELRVEYFKAENSNSHTMDRSKKLDVNGPTMFLDARSENTKELSNHFTANNKTPRALVWINLLNLGKLNYFKDKTLTGDRALARVAEILRRNTRSYDVPVKLPGSEYLMLINDIEARHVEGLRQRLSKAIEQDAELQKIFDEQIDYLNQQIGLSETYEVAEKIYEALKEVKQLREQPRTLVRALILFVNDQPSFEDVMKVL